MIPIVKPTEMEQEIFELELDSFVPDMALDAHAHMWAGTPTYGEASELSSWTEEDMTVAKFRELMTDFMPGRTFGGLMLALPMGIHGMPPAALDTVTFQAEHIASQANPDPLCGSTMFVSPKLDPDYVRQEVQRLNINGLKCYHTESERRPTSDSDIPEYLPEEFIRIAHDFGMTVTLHMVKPRAVADPSNQHWIRTYCEKYPNMNMVLAHAARSFNPVWAMEGIASLKGLPNVYCDTAAIGEVGACEAIIENLGHDRLVWATDFPLTHWRGNYVAFGNTHFWVGSDYVHDDKQDEYVFHGLEQLRVIKQAAWHQRLNDSQVEDIFFNNLGGLLDIIG